VRSNQDADDKLLDLQLEIKTGRRRIIDYLLSPILPLAGESEGAVTGAPAHCGERSFSSTSEKVPRPSFLFS
jgi:hypothetical protein